MIFQPNLHIQSLNINKDKECFCVLIEFLLLAPFFLEDDLFVRYIKEIRHHYPLLFVIKDYLSIYVSDFQL
jgi:hypothetical protein